MGKFAESASKHDIDRRGDGSCVAGRWIAEHLDEDDLVEFERLANNHKWELIIRLSDHKLRQKSLDRHVHGLCGCLEEKPAMNCCSCHREVSS